MRRLAALRERSLASGQSSSAAERLRRVRDVVHDLAPQQEGHVTRGQVESRVGRRLAEAGLVEMVRTGELTELIPGVFRHAAYLPTYQLEDAVALWLSLDPHETAVDRRCRDRVSSTSIAVIGGGAAWKHWELDRSGGPAVLYLPASHPMVEPTENTTVQVRDVPIDDVRWTWNIPYLSVEATIVEFLANWGDIENTAELLVDAMWHYHPLDPAALRRNLHRLAAAGGADGREFWDPDELYDNLVAEAGGWPAQPNRSFTHYWSQVATPMPEALKSMTSKDAPPGSETRSSAEL